MLQRIVAALVGLALILPAIIWGGVPGAQVVCAVALLIALDEYSRMAVPERHGQALLALVLAGGPVYAAALVGPPGLATLLLALGALVLLVGSMVAVPDTDAGARTAVRLVAGLVYVPLLMSYIIQVRRFEGGLAWLFLILAVTWMGDTGAYFAGRAFGRHKLFERVSPKKTWEGFFGGLLAAMAFAALFKVFWLPQLTWAHALVLGALLDLAGVLGDLVESMFKRAYGVKDSGWIMPGHGGILDRIDSLLFTAPVAFAYASAFGLG